MGFVKCFYTIQAHIHFAFCILHFAFCIKKFIKAVHKNKPN